MDIESILTSPFIYSIISSLVYFVYIHLFNKIKRKDVSLLFLLALLIVNYYIRINVIFESMMPLLLNYIIIFAYYKLNLEDQDRTTFINVSIVTLLPVALTYTTHLFLVFNLDFYLTKWFLSFELLHNDYMYFLDIFCRGFILLFSCLLILIFKIKNFSDKDLINRLLLALTSLLSGIYILFLITSYDFLPLAAIFIILLVIIFNYFIDYFETIKEKEKNRNLLNEINKELEKSNRLYVYYLDEHNKLSTLKHKIISEFTQFNKETSPEEYINTIDSLLDPVINRYSNNKTLDMLLVEKALFFQHQDIFYKFNILNDLKFLSEEETTLFFNKIVKIILALKDINHFEIITKSDSVDFYSITYCVNGDKMIDLSSLWEMQTFHSIKKKYKLTSSSLYNGNYTYYSIRLTYEETEKHNEKN